MTLISTSNVMDDSHEVMPMKIMTLISTGTHSLSLFCKQSQSLNGGRLLGSIVKLFRHTPVLTLQPIPFRSVPCHMGIIGTVSNRHSTGITMTTKPPSRLAQVHSSPSLDMPLSVWKSALGTRLSARINGKDPPVLRFGFSMTRIRAKSMCFWSASLGQCNRNRSISLPIFSTRSMESLPSATVQNTAVHWH